MNEVAYAYAFNHTNGYPAVAAWQPAVGGDGNAQQC